MGMENDRIWNWIYDRKMEINSKGDATTKNIKEVKNTRFRTMYSNHYWKPSINTNDGDHVVATNESLIEAGKQLIRSHIFSMCGALITNEPREIVIYMKDVSPAEIAEFEEWQRPDKIEYKRYKEEGNESTRSFKGFRHNGEVFGITRALQALEIRSVRNTGDCKIKAYWREINFNGTMREGLILSNLSEDEIYRKTRVCSQ